MVREIQLTKGYVALVDDDEYAGCAKYNWCAHVTPNSVYATRGMWQDGKYYRIFLHRFILGVPDGVRVDHVDGDGLNCQMFNLRTATSQQNLWNRNPTYSKKPTSGGAWPASIYHGGKALNLGTYREREEAIAVEDAARKLSRGAFGRTINEAIPDWAMNVAQQVLNGAEPPKVIAFSPKAIARRERDRSIRERYASGGVAGKDLAVEFGMSVPGVYAVLRRGNDHLQPRIDALLKANRGGALFRGRSAA